MVFTVEHFRDLIRLLEEHPEWRAELRRQVLSDELLQLPARVQELTETVRQLVQATQEHGRQIAALTETVRQQGRQIAALTETVRQLVQATQEHGRQIAALVEAQGRTDIRLGRLEDQVGALRGSDLERRYREHAAAYFGPLVRRARVLTDHELATLLDDALDAGRVSPRERTDALAVDLVVRGQHPDDGREVYLVVEASVALDMGDVDRAVRRARTLGKLHAAIPVVAGERMTSETQEQAEAAGVAIVLDGRTAGLAEP